MLSMFEYMQMNPNLALGMTVITMFTFALKSVTCDFF